ncbi:hypothetical protein SAMN05216436_105125 [bacterium A37T11]|nr:hypothetical protein SAMN05216436_105125 [bacterium A37T11]
MKGFAFYVLLVFFSYSDFKTIASWGASQHNFILEYPLIYCQIHMNRNLKAITQLTKQLAKKAAAGSLANNDLETLQEVSWETENNLFNTLLAYQDPAMQQHVVLIHLQRLIELNNLLFHAGIAQMDIQDYTDPLNELTLHLYQAFPHVLLDGIRLPDSVRAEQAPQLSERWERLQNGWVKAGVSSLLLQICAIPVTELSALDKPYTADQFQYLLNYLDGLESVIMGDTDEDELEFPLVKRIIELDYNHPNTYGYLGNLIKTEYLLWESKGAQITELERMATEIRQLTVLTDAPYRTSGISLKEELLEWISQEIDYVRKRDDQAMQEEYSHRMHYNLNIRELAVYRNLQFRVQMTLEKTMDEVAENTARNCSSRERLHLKQPSIRSKMSIKDEIVLLPIRGFLMKMVAEIDRFLN